MTHARRAIVVTGVLLPYLARLPGGLEWLAQYTAAGALGFLLLGVLNAITWGSVLAWTAVYRRPALLVLPAAAGFGFAGYWHYTLDLASDPNAAIGVAVIPFWSLVPVALAGGVGYLLDRHPGKGDNR
ncbi:hypothetical protein [Lysobacter sp. A3-1-A15]|uniref:hypothetical protein n=1 Tax=Novilysobacter viscosus TaxID=3098602 RepID=UPI002EDA7C29